MAMINQHRMNWSFYSSFIYCLSTDRPKVLVTREYNASQPDELNLKEGELYCVEKKTDDGELSWNFLSFFIVIYSIFICQMRKKRLTAKGNFICAKKWHINVNLYVIYSLYNWHLHDIQQTLNILSFFR